MRTSRLAGQISEIEYSKPGQKNFPLSTTNPFQARTTAAAPPPVRAIGRAREKIFLKSDETEKLVAMWRDKGFGELNNWMQAARA
jgi:hypothetical protein